MTTKEHHQTVTIAGPEGWESRVRIVSEELLDAEEIQDLLTCAITTPGCLTEPVQVVAVDPVKPRTPHGYPFPIPRRRRLR